MTEHPNNVTPIGLPTYEVGESNPWTPSAKSLRAGA
jgi:hypothetical protein